MQTQPESDEALVRQIVPGSSPSRQAWTACQKSCGEAALRRFIHWANNSTEPDEDILQETLLSAYLSVERGRYIPQDGVPFSAYIRGIARNKIRAACRREHASLSMDAAAGLPDDTRHRPLEAAVEQRELRSRLQHALAQLPPTKRQVIERSLNGEAAGEIAAELSISTDLVRQHRCRALRCLRSSLSGADAA
jgi:RNA polymerase sigma-70 factor, ECF subfamily